MNCETCDEELEEQPGRRSDLLTMKCLKCGRQKTIPKPNSITKVEVKDWKSRCVNCKKWFVGKKPFCSLRCWQIGKPIDTQAYDKWLTKIGKTKEERLKALRSKKY